MNKDSYIGPWNKDRTGPAGYVTVDEYTAFGVQQFFKGKKSNLAKWTDDDIVKILTQLCKEVQCSWEEERMQKAAEIYSDRVVDGDWGEGLREPLRKQCEEDYIAGWKDNPGKWTDTDMEQMYNMGRYSIIHQNIEDTFESCIERIKQYKNATRKEETGTEDISEQ